MNELDVSMNSEGVDHLHNMAPSLFGQTATSMKLGIPIDEVVDFIPSRWVAEARAAIKKWEEENYKITSLRELSAVVYDWTDLVVASDSMFPLTGEN